MLLGLNIIMEMIESVGAITVFFANVRFLNTSK